MSSSTPTPTPTSQSCANPHFILNDCSLVLTITLAILFCPCYTAALWLTIRCIFLCMCGALRAICAALFGRALNAQLDSMEEDRVHGGGGMLIPLVFCGTWMRPPSPTEEAASVGQSEWSSVQVACKSALQVGMGTSESAVSADTSTRPLPNDSKSSSPIQNSPETAMIAMMIQMPSPVLRCWKDREGTRYNFTRPDHALSEYQIGVAQVHLTASLSTQMQPLDERFVVCPLRKKCCWTANPFDLNSSARLELGRSTMPMFPNRPPTNLSMT
ncbi:hypothetical protein EV702DRAFT_1050552 [Suillus placidus]|uniref:Uncharacterized protein n=1 Tax=Suillus placidus TaxID=48579 RepID=A0A9P6ZJZ8_9AGAM|nr:hypothetical protein EV702DRAFT_1050552 [Suillus placidus]